MRGGFKYIWADFKDRFAELDKKHQRDHPHDKKLRSYLLQIKYRITGFDRLKEVGIKEHKINELKLKELKKEEKEDKPLDTRRMKEKLSEADTFLSSIHWLVFDHEKEEIKEMQREFKLMETLLEEESLYVVDMENPPPSVETEIENKSETKTNGNLIIGSDKES